MTYSTKAKISIAAVAVYRHVRKAFPQDIASRNFDLQEIISSNARVSAASSLVFAAIDSCLWAEEDDHIPD